MSARRKDAVRLDVPYRRERSGWVLFIPRGRRIECSLSFDAEAGYRICLKFEDAEAGTFIGPETADHIASRHLNPEVAGQRDLIATLRLKARQVRHANGIWKREGRPRRPLGVAINAEKPNGHEAESRAI